VRAFHYVRDAPVARSVHKDTQNVRAGAEDCKRAAAHDNAVAFSGVLSHRGRDGRDQLFI
jgi:hypothetical protein